MRVLHLCSGNLYGGTESSMLTLARCRDVCPEMESEFAVCFKGRLLDELRRLGAKAYMLCPARLSRPWMVWKVRRLLRGVLKERKPDVVVSHGTWHHALFARVVREHHLTSVFWAHDIQTGEGWLPWLASWSRPDLVLANSATTRASIGNLFSPCPPVEIVFPPVPPLDLSNREETKRKVRASFTTPDDAVVIIIACRLEEWKGHALLLAALALLKDVPGWVCWIGGGAQRPKEEEYLGRLHEQARSAGLTDRLRWLGQRNDIPQVMQSADIHCQPNTGPEPFGISYVEGLHAGLPVVTTAIGGALEIVDDNCGVLVTPGDPVALADALRQLILEPARREELSKHGPLRAREISDPAKIFKRLHGYLEDCLKRHPGTLQ